jgi:hypothetical protein
MLCSLTAIFVPFSPTPALPVTARTPATAKLRFDVRDNAIDAHDTGIPIVPGDSTASEAYRRPTTTDLEDRMPNPDSNLALTDRQIAMVKKWIHQAAVYEEHWAFIPPTRPAGNSIDAFIRRRLAQDGLQPRAEADEASLIRRVTLDLTGLPPTPAEVDAFLDDTSPNAYETGYRPASKRCGVRNSAERAGGLHGPGAAHDRARGTFHSTLSRGLGSPQEHSAWSA